MLQIRLNPRRKVVAGQTTEAVAGTLNAAGDRHMQREPSSIPNQGKVDPYLIVNLAAKGGSDSFKSLATFAVMNKNLSINTGWLGGV